VDAKKKAYSEKDALALARDVNEIYAAKGTKIIHLDLKKNHPDKQSLLKLLLGPSGNLRAPTLRVGKTLIVGFDEAMYRNVLG
jgi:hypothetical protein